MEAAGRIENFRNSIWATFARAARLFNALYRERQVYATARSNKNSTSHHHDSYHACMYANVCACFRAHPNL